MSVLLLTASAALQHLTGQLLRSNIRTLMGLLFCGCIILG